MQITVVTPSRRMHMVPHSISLHNGVTKQTPTTILICWKTITTKSINNSFTMAVLRMDLRGTVKITTSRGSDRIGDTAVTPIQGLIVSLIRDTGNKRHTRIRKMSLLLFHLPIQETPGGLILDTGPGRDMDSDMISLNTDTDFRDIL